MAGKVFLRACEYPLGDELGGAFRVYTRSPFQAFTKRFWRGNASDPFAQALGFASTLAAALGWELVDETGRLTPDFCALVVAEQARNGGAPVIPISVAMDRRAARSADVETSTVVPGDK